MEDKTLARTFSIQLATLDGRALDIPCLGIRPAGADPLPVCLFLFGGGGSVDTLSTLRPMLEEWFRQQIIAPMTIACAGVPPFCFYLDDPARGQYWESLVADALLDEVRARFCSTKRAGLVGISMGGYGALKIAFSRPHTFNAVAAVAPMIEPSLSAQDTLLRNRFHYPSEVPEALLGARRDSNLFNRDHPGGRAINSADEIRKTNLAILLDAGSRDVLNAHDGAEFLHRILWDLDVPHEYHLLRDADHVGPTLLPRIENAFSFVGEYLWERRPLPKDETEISLGVMLEPLKREALRRDPTMGRCYGRLPPVSAVRQGTR